MSGERKAAKARRRAKRQASRSDSGDASAGVYLRFTDKGLYMARELLIDDPERVAKIDRILANRGLAPPPPKG